LSGAIGDAGKKHDLVITSGGVSTGEADYVRDAVEKIGKLVFWRIGIKPGRPVSMAKLPGSRAGEGAAFVGLPGNPVAVFVTFVRVVRPLLLRLAGARMQPLVPLPVRVGFAYRKKAGRREYVRVSLKRRADGELEAIKHPQDGAGVITSLTETDGLLEFGDDVTAVAPGDRAGFLSYAVLMG
jgi:molybdopterin molybdotransferase